MRRALALMTVTVLVAALAPLGGCTGGRPVVESREALGTVVSITAYGDDEAEVREAISVAFDAMADVEAELDAHDPDSAVSAFNRSPYEPTTLPDGATDILDAVVALGVAAEFSPSLLAVSRLYAFEEGGQVPDPADLALAVLAASRYGCSGDGRASFARLATADARLEPGGALAPGLDFGGAAKGLALDRARESLRASGAVSAALISSGSSTVMLGTKPDGGTWRIGIEDPRDADAVVAVFEFADDGALSTSGDYQRYFERDGVRYHHILDPATGLPTTGVRSLTVAGSGLSGLDSDILSTALFVRDADESAAYAAEAGLALFTVNAEGQALLVPAPEDSGVSVAKGATPVR